MVRNKNDGCPYCGGSLKHKDWVRRIKKQPGGKTTWMRIEQFVCRNCQTYHRCLPDSIIPYKHYDASIIQGVICGDVSYYILEYEDYPCEMTMRRWSQNLHSLS